MRSPTAPPRPAVKHPSRRRLPRQRTGLVGAVLVLAGLFVIALVGTVQAAAAQSERPAHASEHQSDTRSHEDDRRHEKRGRHHDTPEPPEQAAVPAVRPAPPEPAAVLAARPAPPAPAPRAPAASPRVRPPVARAQAAVRARPAVLAPPAALPTPAAPGAVLGIQAPSTTVILPPVALLPALPQRTAAAESPVPLALLALLAAFVATLLVATALTTRRRL